LECLEVLFDDINQEAGLKLVLDFLVDAVILAFQDAHGFGDDLVVQFLETLYIFRLLVKSCDLVLLVGEELTQVA
jgi:hypothetical protein